MRKLIYYIASTVDGFIARENGAFDFFPVTGEHLPYVVEEYPETIPTHLREAMCVRGANRHFDAVVMGKRTYDVGASVGITSPYSHLQQYVVSSTMAASPDRAVALISADPVEAVRALKQQDGLGIWLCGGGRLAATLLDEIDEMILKINPIILGTGTPLFRREERPVNLELTEARTFAGGVAIHRYRIARQIAPCIPATPNEALQASEC
jgi:dihydrofolate reductase